MTVDSIRFNESFAAQELASAVMRINFTRRPDRHRITECYLSISHLEKIRNHALKVLAKSDQVKWIKNYLKLIDKHVKEAKEKVDNRLKNKFCKGSEESFKEESQLINNLINFYYKWRDIFNVLYIKILETDISKEEIDKYILEFEKEQEQFKSFGPKMFNYPTDIEGMHTFITELRDMMEKGFKPKENVLFQRIAAINHPDKLDQFFREVVCKSTVAIPVSDRWGDYYVGSGGPISFNLLSEIPRVKATLFFDVMPYSIKTTNFCPLKYINARIESQKNVRSEIATNYRNLTFLPAPPPAAPPAPFPKT